MRVLALVPNLYDTSPGQRYRLEQWVPWLERAGLEITLAPFECAELHRRLHQPGGMARKAWLIGRAFWRRARELARVRDYDAVYVFREAALLGPPVFEYWVKRAGVPIIFDFDDAIFVPYVSPSNSYLSYLKFPGKTRAICRMSAGVMAGNRYLAEYARQVNDNVTVVPTTMDTEKYRRGRAASQDPPVIGWTGSFSTVQHLNTVRGALQRLAQRQRFRLRVIGAPNYELPGVEVEALAWRAATEVHDLSAVDIGIMPLPDNPWTRGKCGCKALQYMGLGIPTVCAPVGVNTEIIRDGENGLIASSEDEWVAKLTQLLESEELRQRLGAAGRATVEQKYSARVHAPRVCQVIQAAADSRPGQRGEMRAAVGK